MTKKIRVEAEMGEGDPPEAVRLEVTQGQTLQSAVATAGEPIVEFIVDDGDYEARATSLVPHGTPATAVFAVPARVTVTIV